MSDFEIHEELKALKTENKDLKAENARLAAELKEAQITLNAAKLKAICDAEIMKDLHGLCIDRERQIAELKRYFEAGVCV